MFVPIPAGARDVVAAALADDTQISSWDGNTYCADVEDHDHSVCYPWEYWPSRDVVAAVAVRGLVDAGWTLTPPAAASGEPAEIAGLPGPVRALVHAVDRMRDRWADAGSAERKRLWADMHAASERVWEAS